MNSYYSLQSRKTTPQLINHYKEICRIFTLQLGHLQIAPETGLKTKTDIRESRTELKLLNFVTLLFCVSPESSVYQAVLTDLQSMSKRLQQ